MINLNKNYNMDKYLKYKKKYLIEKKKIGGRVPYIGSSEKPNFDPFDKKEYSFYLNKRPIVLNQESTTDYEFKEDFTLSAVDVSTFGVITTYKLKDYIHHYIKLNGEDYPFSLCFIHNKFNLLENLINLINNIFTNLISTIPTITEAEIPDFESKIILNKDIINRILIVPYKTNKLFGDTLIKLITHPTPDTEEEKKKKEDTINKLLPRDSKDEIIKSLRKLYNKREISKFIECVNFNFLNFEIYKNNIKTNLENIIQEFIKSIKNLFNIFLYKDTANGNEFYRYIDITNTHTILNKYSFANKTKELLNIILNDRITENEEIKNGIQNIFNIENPSVSSPNKQSFINLSDFIEHYKKYYNINKNTEKERKEQLELVKKDIESKIKKGEDLNNYEKHIKNDIKDIKTLKKLIQITNKIDDIIEFHTLFNIKLSIFLFMSWLSNRFYKKYFYLRYKNIELNNIYPINTDNLLENFFKPNDEPFIIDSDPTIRICNNMIINNDTNYIPIFRYDYSEYKGNSFPDCVETTIFHILKIIFYNQETQKYDNFPDIIKPKQELKDIFGTYDEKEDGNKVDRNKFAELVSNIPGIIYARTITIEGIDEKYELDSTVENIQNVLYYLLFGATSETFKNEENYNNLKSLFKKYEHTTDGDKVIITIKKDRIYIINVMSYHSQLNTTDTNEDDTSKKLTPYLYNNLIYLFTSIIKEMDDKKNTFLHILAKLGDIKTVNIDLNQKHIDINIKNYDNETPLHEATKNGHKEMVKLLILNGADKDATNKIGDTPLHLASFNGYIDIVKLLIEKGANKNTPNIAGNTPLHVAINYRKEKIVELLILNGADKNTQNEDGNTPLHLASSHGYTEIVELLIHNGADIDINATNTIGDTPLNVAINCKEKKIVELLIDNRVDINAKNIYGNTPLHLASSYGDIEIVKLLIHNGVDINATNEIGNTPLHLAVLSGNIEVIRLLMTDKTNINAQNKEGDTPLHLSGLKKNKNEDIKKLLIENGANQQIINIYGFTAIDTVYSLLFSSHKKKKKKKSDDSDDSDSDDSDSDDSDSDDSDSDSD